MRTLTIDDIQRVVAFRRYITVPEIRGQRRNFIFSWPRQEAMTLAREFTGHSYKEIGDRFGDRDHTTVIHAIRRVRERSDESSAYRRDLDEMRAYLDRAAAARAAISARIGPPTRAEAQRLRWIDLASSEETQLLSPLEVELRAARAAADFLLYFARSAELDDTAEGDVLRRQIQIASADLTRTTIARRMVGVTTRGDVLWRQRKAGVYAELMAAPDRRASR